MNSTKLRTCLVAALVTGVGAATLAAPALASSANREMCTDYQLAYAQGYANGACGGFGTVTSCNAYYFTYYC